MHAVGRGTPGAKLGFLLVVIWSIMQAGSHNFWELEGSKKLRGHITAPMVLKCCHAPMAGEQLGTLEKLTLILTV